MSTMKEKALKAFQNAHGIRETGEFDEATQDLMNIPRCGFKENYQWNSTTNKLSNYQEVSRWSKKDLTYKITMYSRKLSRTQVDEAVKRSFDLWSHYTDLKFTQMSYEVETDLEISYVFSLF